MYKKLDEKTMHLILETGIDQFARFGLDRANINTIAKAAGVSVGVLYKYFGDKDSFFSGLRAPLSGSAGSGSARGRGARNGY